MRFWEFIRNDFWCFIEANFGFFGFLGFISAVFMLFMFMLVFEFYFVSKNTRRYRNFFFFFLIIIINSRNNCWRSMRFKMRFWEFIRNDFWCFIETNFGFLGFIFAVFMLFMFMLVFEFYFISKNTRRYRNFFFFFLLIIIFSSRNNCWRSMRFEMRFWEFIRNDFWCFIEANFGFFGFLGFISAVFMLFMFMLVFEFYFVSKNTRRYRNFFFFFLIIIINSRNNCWRSMRFKMRFWEFIRNDFWCFIETNFRFFRFLCFAWFICFAKNK